MENTDSVNELRSYIVIILAYIFWVANTCIIEKLNIQTSTEYAFEMCEFKHGWWKA